MEGTNGLTAKQFEFALEYASGEHKGHATKAYLKAYGCASENGAAASASQLLRKPNVAKLISEVLSKREEAAIEQERGWVELSRKEVCFTRIAVVGPQRESTSR